MGCKNFDYYVEVDDIVVNYVVDSFDVVGVDGKEECFLEVGCGCVLNCYLIKVIDFLYVRRIIFIVFKYGYSIYSVIRKLFLKILRSGLRNINFILEVLVYV